MLLKGGYRAETFAVFPNFKEAESAAHAALNPTVGGYGHVKIEMTTGDVTHESVHDWIAED